MYQKINVYRGIFAYFKESGVNPYLVTKWILLHLNQETSGFMSTHNIKVKFYGDLDTFTSGVMTISIGSMDRYLKYLQFAPMSCELDVKLGLSTVTSFVDGNVKNNKPFDHVDQTLVQTACNSLIGERIQRVPPRITFREPQELIWNEPVFKPINFDRENVYRKVDCQSIDVVRFNQLNFTLKVNYLGRFSVRGLIEELNEIMNTSCTITKATSVQQGPFTIKDCIYKTDLYWKYMKQAIDRHTPRFVNYTQPFLDKLPFYEERRVW